MKRRHAASTQARIDPDRWLAVKALLAEDWSPGQITAEVFISHERVYGPRPTRPTYHRRSSPRWGAIAAPALSQATARRHRGGTPRQR